MNIPGQVPRLAAVFLVAVTALLVARGVLIPETFGDIGHYRAAAVDSIAAREISYAGQQECAMCHGPVVAVKHEGNHRGVSCEVCHGPAVEHTRAPLDFTPVAPRARELCTLCHSYNTARPTGFAQIDPVAHNPMIPCMTCHEPHEPEPPVTPGDCSACHGQIAREKAVSHHAGLSCTTCHEAPDEHKVDPQSVQPTKPADRAFCGACHSSGIESIPQVDLRSHEPGYDCWQCHYPHRPEA